MHGECWAYVASMSTFSQNEMVTLVECQEIPGWEQLATCAASQAYATSCQVAVTSHQGDMHSRATKRHCISSYKGNPLLCVSSSHIQGIQFCMIGCRWPSDANQAGLARHAVRPSRCCIPARQKLKAAQESLIQDCQSRAQVVSACYTGTHQDQHSLPRCCMTSLVLDPSRHRACWPLHVSLL